MKNLACKATAGIDRREESVINNNLTSGMMTVALILP